MMVNSQGSIWISWLDIRCSQNPKPKYAWRSPFVFAVWIGMMGRAQNVKEIKAELEACSKVVTRFNLLKWLPVDLPLVCQKVNNYMGRGTLYYAHTRRWFWIAVRLQVSIHYNFVRTPMKNPVVSWISLTCHRNPREEMEPINVIYRCNLQRQFRKKYNYPSWHFSISWKLSPHLLKFWKIVLISQGFLKLCFSLEMPFPQKFAQGVTPGIIIILILKSWPNKHKHTHICAYSLIDIWKEFYSSSFILQLTKCVWLATMGQAQC